MNFYQMDVNEIERYMRNNSIGISDIMQSLIDQLKEVSGKYENLTEVLYELYLSDDASILEDELRTVYYDWDCDQTELKNLKEENETLKDEIDNLKHEISYLQNDLNVLKEDF